MLVTSCGQSPGPLKLTVFLKRLGIEYDYKADATAKDLAAKPYKTLIIVTGASLKGMGAAYKASGAGVRSLQDYHSALR